MRSRSKKRDKHKYDPPEWPLSPLCYKLDHIIGVGTFGCVWQGHCFDPTSEYHMKKVAIKVINLEWFGKHSELEDIRNEIQIMSKNQHPNVLSYYVDFVHDNELWLVMPLITLGSLENII